MHKACLYMGGRRIVFGFKAHAVSVKGPDTLGELEYWCSRLGVHNSGDTSPVPETGPGSNRCEIKTTVGCDIVYLLMARPYGHAGAGPAYLRAKSVLDETLARLRREKSRIRLIVTWTEALGASDWTPAGPPTSALVV